MRIVVCVKQTAAGELNPFDACAYEAALKIENSEVILLSMGPEKTADMLKGLTRLGAARAVLLTDRAFAGADTLATAYTLSLAVKMLKPDLVLCGRQTMDGDTAQVGPGLAQMCGYELITNVMDLSGISDEKITCATRGGDETARLPAVLTLERINTLRLPSIRSRPGTVERMNAADIGADVSRCGLNGSPTRVLKTFENEEGRRRCRFITPNELPDAIADGLHRAEERLKPAVNTGKKIGRVWIIGEKPMDAAKTISDDITVMPFSSATELARRAADEKPEVILWASDRESKRLAPQVAAILKTGLCADCTALETDGQRLYMYRPAFSGNIIAKIVCETSPAMATVRTPEDNTADIIVAAGMGAKAYIEPLKQFADKYGAGFAASRAMVDAGDLPYEMQVGLTGKTVCPGVYIAVGISGAVHHIAGMKSSGTVIAVNPDKNAPIFNYADYGIIAGSEIFAKKISSD